MQWCFKSRKADKWLVAKEGVNTIRTPNVDLLGFVANDMSDLNLNTSTLTDLKNEPFRLQIQAEETSEQLRSLVLHNYQVFIRSNQCSKVVRDELMQIKSTLDTVESKIPSLNHHCEAFLKNLEQTVTKHGDLQFVLEHFFQLTELLEIPQLLEACIHNELFEEAIEMIQFANELFHNEVTSKEKPQCNFILEALMKDVNQMSLLLRERLLQKLQQDLQLAICVRIVSYLRRVDTIRDGAFVTTPDYEAQLKQEFLSRRQVWLASHVRVINVLDPYQYMIQVIDRKRTSWFDMITQYSAIFGNENVDGKVDPALCRWATQNVTDFIRILQKQLPKIDDFSCIAAVAEQSLFFGGSLGRVGVDFRAILAIYFENHVLHIVAKKWQETCQEFEETLNAHGITSSGRGGGNGFAASASTPLMLSSSSARVSSGSNSLLQYTSKDDFSPPRSLMSFPILAELTNGFLMCWNDFRLCAIASLNVRLAKRFQHSLWTLIGCMGKFCEQNKLRLDALSSSVIDNGCNSSMRSLPLENQMQEMVKAFRYEFIPYMIKCFHRLFPTTSSCLVCLCEEHYDERMRDAKLLSPLERDSSTTINASEPKIESSVVAAYEPQREEEEV